MWYARERENRDLIRESKVRTINISPVCGDHAPEPIDNGTPFSVLTAKVYVDSLTNF